VDGGHGLRAVAALAHHLPRPLVLQQRQHAVARHRLVVHHQGPYLAHATLRDSSISSASTVNGITIVTARPPACRCLELERVVSGIEVLEARAGVGQPDAGVERVQLVGGTP
jgi:hypothetical protein